MSALPAVVRARSSATLRRIDVVLLGARGQVGSALRQRLAARQLALRGETGLDLRLVAAADTRGFAFDLDGLPPTDLDGHLRHRDEFELAQVFRRLGRIGSPPALLVDCTASADVASRYAEWLSSGLGVVAANKLANAGSLEYFDRLQALSLQHHAPYRYEATVGAAIPLLAPLRDLRLRGEKVNAIQGVLSGSLSYLLQRLHMGTPFSTALAEARSLGYTEPDPGEDLRAQDLRRKLLVLGREAGFALEEDAVTVTPFPHAWPPEAADAEWHARISDTEIRGERWVMLAEVDRNGARIGLRSLPRDSPFAALQPGENRIRVETDLQTERPLWLGGAGAGPAVTAAAVFSDMLAAATLLALRG